MNITLYLPPGHMLSHSQKLGLQTLAEEYDMCCDWGDAQATKSDIPDNEASNWVTDTDVLDLDEVIMTDIARLNIPAAVHVDASDDSEACEWNHRSYLTWYDPKTRTEYYQPSGTESRGPLFETDVIMRLLRSPDCVDEWMQRLEPLRLLGIEDPFEAASKEEVGDYISHKVATRLDDAETCTSHRDEYKTLYQSGIPNPCVLSAEHIREIIHGGDEDA